MYTFLKIPDKFSPKKMEPDKNNAAHLWSRKKPEKTSDLSQLNIRLFPEILKREVTGSLVGL